MAQIKTEKQYKATCDRINELLQVVSNDTPADDRKQAEHRPCHRAWSVKPRFSP